MSRLRFAVVLVLLACAANSSAIAQSGTATSSNSKRSLLLACGLPGDEPHRERLTTACSQIIDSIEKIGVSKSNLQVLSGDDQMREKLASEGMQIDLCTKESMQSAIAKIAEQSKPADECWIILLGHAALYDRTSKFNISGPDFDQKEFAVYLEKLPAIRQVVWLSFPVSGQWIKPLSFSNRVVISATEADLEYTATEMPYSLAKAISRTDSTLSDIDGDGTLTLLDLYVCSALDVADVFLKDEKLQTEHSQLDDSGDGRGSEVQASYLKEKYEAALKPPAEGDTALQSVVAQAPPATKRVIIPRGNDGWLSQRILLQP